MTKKKASPRFLDWKLLFKREGRHRRGSGKGANLVMEAIEERRKLGEEDEGARNEEIKSGDEQDGGASGASWRGFAVTKTE